RLASEELNQADFTLGGSIRLAEARCKRTEQLTSSACQERGILGTVSRQPRGPLKRRGGRVALDVFNDHGGAVLDRQTALHVTDTNASVTLKIGCTHADAGTDA